MAIPIATGILIPIPILINELNENGMTSNIDSSTS